MAIPIKQLASLIASNEERFSGPEYVRGESANFLAFEDQPDELRQILERLVLCQPGRLFLLRSGTEANNSAIGTGSEISADLKISQHKISNEISLWNEEILILGAGRESWGRIPSVLRSFIISSAPLFAILPGKQQISLFAKLGLKVDWVIIDSGSDPQVLQEVVSLGRAVSRGVIDLQWLALAQLRELIRREFDDKELQQHLGLIRRVEINSASRIDGSSPLLMVGWIANCLGADPVRLGPWGIECQRGGEPSLNLSFSPAVLAELQAINKGPVKDISDNGVAKSLRSEGGVEEGLNLKVRFEDANGASIASFSFSLDQKLSHKAELVERYFSLGESVANYTSSARRALEILRLQQAYDVNEIVGEDW